MPSSFDYIRTLEKEIENLKKLVAFYEEIILSNEELRNSYKYRKHIGNKDRRNNYDNSQRNSR